MRQIPVADIAALSLNEPTDVKLEGCGVPGFYYSLYGADGVHALPETGTGYGPVLCGVDRDVGRTGVVFAVKST